MHNVGNKAILILISSLTILCGCQAVNHEVETESRDLRSSAILSYIVNTDIKLHYSQTTIESRISNPTASSFTHVFEAIVPDTAILSECRVESGGQVINGSIANKISEITRTSNLWVRKANMISISLSMVARSEMKVFVNYHQILERKRNHYYHTSYINNNLIGRVGELKISTNVEETGQLGFLCVPFNQRDSEVIHRSPNNVEVVWLPTRNSDSNTPCSVSQYTVQYGDIVDNGNGNGTDLIIIDDLFFHVYVPTELQLLRKHVVYVLDISGSMAGARLTQLKTAMVATLNIMKPDDYLNIITFHSSFAHWQNAIGTPVPATPANIQNAISFVNGLVIGGMTHTNGAFQQTYNLIHAIRSGNKLPAMVESMIFFLTDGAPSDATTAEIIANWGYQNSGYKVPTHSIGLGLTETGSAFLNVLSLQNYGKFERIRDGNGAGQQLSEFYASLSMPVIANLNLQYNSEDFVISDVTKSVFPTVAQGVDIKVCGKLTPIRPGNGPFKLIIIITGNNRDGPFRIVSEVYITPTKSRNSDESQVAQKFYAQLKINQLVENHIATGNANLKTQAQALSIQHKFVSTYTSMTLRSGAAQIVDPFPIVPSSEAKCAMINDISNGICANRILQ